MKFVYGFSQLKTLIYAVTHRLFVGEEHNKVGEKKVGQRSQHLGAAK